MSIFEEIEQRAEAQRVTYADCDPLGWTTWPLALAEELGEVVKAAMHRRGVTAWVEREGDIAQGDEITVWLPPNRPYPHMPLA